MNEVSLEKYAKAEARIAELEAELRAAKSSRAAAVDTAEAALTRLQAWEPVVKAARRVVDNYEGKNDADGPASCVALHQAVLALPPEPS